MSIYSSQGPGGPRPPPTVSKDAVDNTTQLVSKAALLNSPPGNNSIDPHADARTIIRLIQCSECSLPLQSPLTLPCGNSLCRKCVPALHVREHISYPNTENRQQGFLCPFDSCAKVHVLSDCSQDVTLSKIMERVATEIASHRSLMLDTPTLLDERLHWKNMVDSSKDERTPSSRVLNGGRLLATYTLAELGDLRYDSDVAYQTMSPTGDRYELLDISMLQHLKEATKNELDCQVCYALIHDPLTTPCGHTFCRKCVARMIDHSPLCAICRRALRLPPGVRSIPANRRIISLLDTLCPDLVAARAEAIAQEGLIQGDTNVPLFVCTASFPSMPTFLHIFEPRYRLMMRRAVESAERRFGMLMYNGRMQDQGDLGATQFMLYGTMLQINSVQMTMDGRSMLDTRGTFRFRVKSWKMVDGYIVGDIERLNDIPLEEEEALEARETTQPVSTPDDLVGQINSTPTLDLLQIGTDFVRRMSAVSAPWLRGAHFESHGEMPEDPTLFPYWFASILPISEEEKYRLLPTTSVRERLKITATWVKRIETQRWYVIPHFQDFLSHSSRVFCACDASLIFFSQTEGTMMTVSSLHMTMMNPMFLSRQRTMTIMKVKTALMTRCPSLVQSAPMTKDPKCHPQQSQISR